MKKNFVLVFLLSLVVGFLLIETAFLVGNLITGHSIFQWFSDDGGDVKSISKMGVVGDVGFKGGYEAQDSSQIIADHNAVGKFDKIPREWINNVKKDIHIAYGHTSHGSQIISGMNVLQAIDSIYSWSHDNQAPSKLHLFEGSGYNTNGDLALDCGYEGWDTRTRNYLGQTNAQGRGSNHPEINVLVWSWCGQVDNIVDLENHYLKPMAKLEKDYPGIKFIYMTGHLEGSKNAKVRAANDKIRNWVKADSNRILYDFADIESYDPDGNDYFSKGAGIGDDGCRYNGGNWCSEWCGAHQSSDLCRQTSCAHSSSLNCNMKGRAFWYLLARIAGWDDGQSGEFDFSLSLNPSSASVQRGKIVQSIVKVTKIRGNNEEVRFSASSLPSGISVSFNPTSCIPSSGSCTSVMSVSVDSAASVGNNLIQVMGRSQSVSHEGGFSLNVQENSGVNAQIEVYKKEGMAPFTVLFNGFGSTSQSGNIVKYEWDFGDSNNQYLQKDLGRLVGHRFDNPGTYTVNLKVTDENGGTGQTSIQIKVLDRPSTAKTYYVSSSEGDDNNDGLSPNRPWKSFSKVLSEASSIPDGSKILFRRGDTFTQQNSFNLNPLMREGPYYLTLGAYGTGEKPIFDPAKKDPAMDTSGAKEGKGIVIEDLHVVGATYIRPSYYSNSEPKGFREPGVQAIVRRCLVDGDNASIIVWASTGDVIEDTIIDDTNTKHYHVGLGSAEAPGINYLYVRNLEVKSAWSHCIYFAGYGKNSLVEKSNLHHCGIHGTSRDAFTVHGKFENIVLRKSDLHHNNYAFGIDDGYEWSEEMKDFVIEQNRIHDQRSYVSQIAAVNGLIIRNNLFYNNALGGAGSPIINIQTPDNYKGQRDHDTEHIRVLNNVFYNNRGTIFSVGDEQVDDVQIKNNIVLENLDRVVDARNSQNVVFKNNLYYGNTGSFIMGGKTYTNSQKWISEGNDENSLNEDPKLENPNSLNFKPKASSPAIDKGSKALVSDDFEGNPRPNGATYDIGAYEYQGPKKCGNANDCDDGNVCTDDSCVSGVCQYSYNSASCEDGNACTLNDYCSSGVCHSGTTKDCGDGYYCTTDSCNSKTGECLHQRNDGYCSSNGLGNVCDPSKYSKPSGCGTNKQAPKISDGEPSGTIVLRRVDRTVTIGVKTDVPAECKYDDRQGILYENMKYSFEDAANGLIHYARTVVEGGKSYLFYVRCKAGVENKEDYEIKFSVKNPEVKFREGYFNGLTTKFEGNLRNIQPILERENYGIIAYTVPMSILREINLENMILIEKNRIFVDSEILPEFNKPANIGFYDVQLKSAVPWIYKDKEVCKKPFCSFITKTKKGNKEVFSYHVTSFSNYELGENCSEFDKDQDGYSSVGNLCGAADCDDSNKDIHPGAKEVCGNGKDDDCDGGVDEGCGGGGGNNGGRGSGSNEKVSCGDKKCSIGEDCRGCPEDCGVCKKNKTEKNESFEKKKVEIDLDKKNWSVVSVPIGTKIVLRINSKMHEIELRRNGSLIVINFGKDYVLEKGKGKRIDVDGDGREDVLITLEKISDKNEISFMRLSSMRERPKRKLGFLLAVIAILVILWIAGVVYYILKRRKRKEIIRKISGGKFGRIRA